ncbi:hypothetical protein Q31a_17960 [Aureliella helgolandensis]|uniref:Uncharacterized protein n=1 Tax=Aureliella helgolandensis TaxID=2527968 RepID=A0A518G4H1_9BACT|nr:hypothetical protein Q31a_17960 [Aureliella helgolandensis]
MQCWKTANAPHVHYLVQAMRFGMRADGIRKCEKVSLVAHCGQLQLGFDLVCGLLHDSVGLARKCSAAGSHTSLYTRFSQSTS